jgi:hypothetical protein
MERAKASKFQDDYESENDKRSTIIRHIVHSKGEDTNCLGAVKRSFVQKTCL